MICSGCCNGKPCLGFLRHPTYCDNQHKGQSSAPPVKRDLATEFNLYPGGRPVKIRLHTADPGPDKVSIFDKPWKELM